MMIPTCSIPRTRPSPRCRRTAPACSRPHELLGARMRDSDRSRVPWPRRGSVPLRGSIAGPAYRSTRVPFSRRHELRWSQLTRRSSTNSSPTRLPACAATAVARVLRELLRRRLIARERVAQHDLGAEPGRSRLSRDGSRRRYFEHSRRAARHTSRPTRPAASRASRARGCAPSARTRTSTTRFAARLARPSVRAARTTAASGAATRSARSSRTSRCARRRGRTRTLRRRHLDLLAAAHEQRSSLGRLQLCAALAPGRRLDALPCASPSRTTASRTALRASVGSSTAAVARFAQDLAHEPVQTPAKLSRR